jgi:sarcosine oxidase subunit alpha
VAGWCAPLIPAGFYYKTFMGPSWLGRLHIWSKLFEPMIRRAAGLGRAPSEPDPDAYINRYVHCDVLVIGAGPAGIAAARSAVLAGATVVLCDEQAELGGSLLAEQHAQIDDRPAQVWLAAHTAELESAGVTLLTRTTAFGYYASNFVALAERLTDHLDECPAGAPRERLWQVRAREVVIAAGAIERPLVFPNNDRPGVMLADAAQSYLNRYGVKVGRRAVVATACDSAYRAALDLHAAGIEIAAICDLREQPPESIVAAVEAHGIQVMRATAIADTSGRSRVTGTTTLRQGDVRKGATIACDVVLMCGGWTPSVHLFSQAHGRLAWNAEAMAYLPARASRAQQSAGACRGQLSLLEVLADGDAVGATAARAVGLSPSALAAAAVSQAWSYGGGHLGTSPGEADGAAAKSFVDLQNDVTVADLELAVREGFRSIEHIKRYTTTGMATDQGKTSNLHALAIAASASGRSIPEIGLTSFRQPYTPVTFGTLAGSARGDLLDPLRLPPSTLWTQSRGAIFEDVGQWRRAQYFPRSGESRRAAMVRECRTVRQKVGVFDASTLGKIEVIGPDACEFLERMYVNALGGLAVGRCRYALLLNEAGYIIDDGIIARLAEDRFHVTTTTGGAARVLDLMEDYAQTEWPELAVWLTSITEQWTAIALQGPLSRDLLTRLCPELDLGDAAMPHMSVTEQAILGMAARIFRISFSGELGFEINIPSGYGLALWEALVEAAEAVDGCAYGTDTMHALRAEKGYIVVGQETDGTMVPADVGLSWLVGKNKTDFVGKRSLERSGMQRTDRPQLVGLLSESPEIVLEEGAQLTAGAEPLAATPALGFVSSAYYSATLDRSIALAMVAGGRARHGERLYVPMPDATLAVEVVSPIFFDRKGKRLDG